VINGNRTEIGKPSPNPQATPGTATSESFGPTYDAFAAVRLDPRGLRITKEPALKWQRLPKELGNINWQWELVSSDDTATQASFKFHVDVIYVANDVRKTTDIPLRFWKYDWVDESGGEFTTEIGPSAFSVAAASYGCPISGLGGVAALVTGRRRRKKGKGDETDEVITSVFSPTHTAPGRSFYVQVFAHLAEEEGLLKDIAQRVESATVLADSDALEQQIARGTELTFLLSMPGLTIDEPKQSRTWNGKRIRVLFGVSVPQDTALGEILARVTIFDKALPLGHLGFKIQVAVSTTEAETMPSSAGSAIRYRQAFVSYARRDQLEVLKRLQVLEVERQKYFQDVDIKPGEEWQNLIYQKISESDVLFLFWSKAASESEWVGKEIDYALSRQAGDYQAPPQIYPFVIPPPVDPPQNLSHLQFGDNISRMILAAEQIANSGPGNPEQDGT
jgi:hypothetical protein